MEALTYYLFGVIVSMKKYLPQLRPPASANNVLVPGRPAH